ncbi:head GIN domain-containing protein [Erythrobacter donghaensis]|uniref:head GIN domain-containing protein n=1 Tax=Erythrobacter donghaensis TaxID=267135 RepID=UPI000A3C3836|nr:head GIN domain-containing protein [Erythrobacter donghaensis]
MIQLTRRHTVPAIAAMAALSSLAACSGADISINGKDGVPLSEVEIAGPAPSEVVLASGDTVILTEGETFALKVEGSNTDSLRFVRDDETIGITREKGWNGSSDATIRITMPAPKEVTIAGSGTIKAATLASTSEIAIGGSGTVEFGTIAAEKLAISIGGSGKVTGAGTVRNLEISIGGSGDVEMPGLKADTAEISIGGAGDVAFASDGEVTASIAGAGDINVTGKAKCTVSAFGSGSLNCAEGTATAAAAPTPPAAPQAPVAPEPAE